MKKQDVSVTITRGGSETPEFAKFKNSRLVKNSGDINLDKSKIKAYIVDLDLSDEKTDIIEEKLYDSSGEYELEGIEDLGSPKKEATQEDMIKDLMQIAKKIGFKRWNADKLYSICSNAMHSREKLKKSLLRYSGKKKSIVKKKKSNQLTASVINDLLPGGLGQDYGSVAKYFTKYLADDYQQVVADYEVAQGEVDKGKATAKTQHRNNIIAGIGTSIQGLIVLAGLVAFISQMWISYGS